MFRKGKEVARIFTEYSKKVRKKLIDMDRSQDWLVQQVAEKTGMYFDDGYLSKIFTGKRNPPIIIEAINQILGLEAE